MKHTGMLRPGWLVRGARLKKRGTWKHPGNDWRNEMQIIIAPLLGCLMPVLAVLGLFWALWGCPFNRPDSVGDGSHPARSK